MAVARADLVGSTSTFTLYIQLKQILETQEMICYVLAMGKQRLRPHVVVGYGIKIFWPGLFITSPDHLDDVYSLSSVHVSLGVDSQYNSLNDLTPIASKPMHFPQVI